MQELMRIILGIISTAILVLGIGLWAAGVGQAGPNDPEPQTAGDTKSGLIFKKLGI